MSLARQAKEVYTAVREDCVDICSLIDPLCITVWEVSLHWRRLLTKTLLVDTCMSCYF